MMGFDFQKLEVYKKAKNYHSSALRIIEENQFPNYTNDQLARASFSIVLNIAEGSGRFSKRDRRHFYVISRSSLWECSAILDILKDENHINIVTFNQFYV